MLKIRRLILLALCLTIWITGCGDSTGGYGIFRSRDIITVFVPLPDTSEIADVKVDNKALRMAIDTGEKIVPREIKLQRRLLQVVESDETVEIHGKNRINDYAVIHLRAFDTKYKVSKFIKVHASVFYDGLKITNSREKPELFDNSGAFRFGDKIVAYCRLQGNIDLQPKGFKINIGGVEVKRTVATINRHMVTEDEIGERILILGDYQINKDERIRNLHFLLKDLEPHETVEIEEVKNLGNKIVIAELAVESRWEQTLEPQLPEQPQVPEQISDR
jgi:hypothetical protein